MIGKAHLQDDALFECYYAARRGEAMDPPSAEHLTDCSVCATRYAEIGTFLGTLSEEAEADFDALFPPERLQAQQQSIAKRLQLVGRAARVISFPGRSAGQATPSSRLAFGNLSRLTTRWIAAAAAAGLFVGVAAGTIFNFGPRFDFARESRRSSAPVASRQTASPAPSRLSPAVEKAVAGNIDTDDVFMSDLEAVLDRPHTSELVAFDELTPHVRDVRDFSR